MNFENYLKEMPDLETKRLKLRKLTFSDLNDVHYFCSNPKVANPMTWEVNKTIEVTNDFLKAVISGYENGESGEWAIELKDTGKVIGVAAFIDWNNEHSCLEIGYFLSEDFWGKGIVTEALNKILHYGFDVLSPNRIEGRCDTDNFASQKIMQKMGMKYEGTLRKNEYIKGEFRDTQMYSILKTEYTNSSKIRLH
ncbi:GNAT family N-acetyltransferase [Aquibacillus sediminis]|uniref:GNAT family N-acetyltransferase n=1 Tax=Aquibacillus sediminis TaxID=2574734 RepID=UPI0011098527|nr:GNAT family protein [Aquibacillus sediminis]